MPLVPTAGTRYRPGVAQDDLFAAGAPREVRAANVAREIVELARELPGELRFGTMSWAYPGWEGKVYGERAKPHRLSELGLTAYAKHPLFRAVEIDRTHYEPLGAAALRAHADQVPGDFRFVMKAHEECTLNRFPQHARYGKRRGEPNPRYLDAAYASDAVVGPFLEGFGAKAGVLLFQLAPQDVGPSFADRLHHFLAALPRGATYAVEVRNAELLGPDYADALSSAGAIHCHNVWRTMPGVRAQARRLPPALRRPLLVRWLLRAGTTYEDTGERFAPYDRLVDEDPDNREDVAALAALALRHQVPSIVLVNNNVEGCAPDSIALLASRVRTLLSSAP